MKIETVKIADIRLDTNNANTHDEVSIAALVHSLEEFGQQKIVVLDHQSTVRAGNGIVLAN